MRRLAPERQPLLYIARYIWRHRTAHGVIVLAVIGAAVASVGARYSLKYLVDAMGDGPGRLAAVWSAVVIFGVCVAADNLLWRVGGWVAARVFPAIGAELRLDLLDHLLGQSARYFNDRFSGALASRVMTVSNGIFTLGNLFIWNVLPAAAATIGAIVGLATVDLWMAVALAVAAAVVAIGIAAASARGRPLNQAFAERAAEVGGEVVDVVANHGIVRVFANRARETARLGGAMRGEATAQRRALLYIEKLRLTHAAIVALFSTAILAWSISLWAKGAISAGDVVVCGTFTLALLQASRDLAVAIVDVNHHWSRVGEAVATLTLPHDLPDHPEASEFAPAGGQILFEGVSFSHAGEASEPVLDGIELRIAAGERVGVVGPSGAGKSTLLALLQRLYPVSRGRILLDGQDIAELRQESLRRAIATVPQDISLFNRSILDNIRYGRPDAPDGEVIAAARAAQCDDFIRRLPQGYQTLVGEHGIRLSVGQKQRVAIARAILADAPIILLDEATSALDSESENAVQAALAELMRGRTILAVAHRLSTLAGFDRVIVIADGRIVEDGPPDLLRRRGGVFARLWQGQYKGFETEMTIEEIWSERTRNEPLQPLPARRTAGR